MNSFPHALQDAIRAMPLQQRRQLFRLIEARLRVWVVLHHGYGQETMNAERWQERFKAIEKEMTQNGDAKKTPRL